MPRTLVNKLLKYVALVGVTNVPVNAVTVDGGVWLRFANANVFERVTFWVAVGVVDAVVDGDAVVSLEVVRVSLIVGVIVLEVEMFGHVPVLEMGSDLDEEVEGVGVGVTDNVDDGDSETLLVGDGVGVSEVVADCVNESDGFVNTSDADSVRFGDAVTFGGGVGVLETVGVSSDCEIVLDGDIDSVTELDVEGVCDMFTDTVGESLVDELSEILADGRVLVRFGVELGVAEGEMLEELDGVALREGVPLVVGVMLGLEVVVAVRFTVALDVGVEDSDGVDDSLTVCDVEGDEEGLIDAFTVPVGENDEVDVPLCDGDVDALAETLPEGVGELLAVRETELVSEAFDDAVGVMLPVGEGVAVGVPCEFVRVVLGDLVTE